MQIRTLVIAFGTSLISVMGASAAPMTADEVLSHVREACKVTKGNIPPEGLVLSGTRVQGGLPAEFKLQFDSNGRFLQTSTGKITSVLGFDGTTVWGGRGSSAYRPLEMIERDQNLVDALILSGLWMEENCGMTFSMLDTSPHTAVLAFKHSASGQGGRVLIEQGEWVARIWRYDGEEQREIKTSGTLSSLGFKFPARIERGTTHGKEDIFELKSLEKAAGAAESPFVPKLRPPTNITWNSQLSGRLEVKRAHNGFFLVRPLVNGKDIGTFLFDTGAATTIVDTRGVKKLKAQTVGEIPLVGTSGDSKASDLMAESFAIGNVTFSNEDLLAADVSFIDGLVGEEVAGIVGANVLWGCVVELSVANSTVELFDPAKYDEARVGKAWTPLYVVGEQPIIQAVFEGHDGVFVVDSAAQDLSLSGDVVKKFDLLTGRALEDMTMIGVGGASPAKHGTISKLEFGGLIQESVPTTFRDRPSPGPTSGVIGVNVLNPFTVVFDYQHRRMGFVKR